MKCPLCLGSVGTYVCVYIYELNEVFFFFNLMNLILQGRHPTCFLLVFLIAARSAVIAVTDKTVLTSGSWTRCWTYYSCIQRLFLTKNDVKSYSMDLQCYWLPPVSIMTRISNPNSTFLFMSTAFYVKSKSKRPLFVHWCRSNQCVLYELL